MNRAGETYRGSRQAQYQVLEFLGRPSIVRGGGSSPASERSERRLSGNEGSLRRCPPACIEVSGHGSDRKRGGKGPSHGQAFYTQIDERHMVWHGIVLLLKSA
jgi:hypothetical protein